MLSTYWIIWYVALLGKLTKLYLKDIFSALFNLAIMVLSMNILREDALAAYSFMGKVKKNQIQSLW